MPVPKPRFFIVRPGAEEFTSMGELIVQPSTIVPLIPVDLLPEWLRVVGVPRSLQPDQTSDMISLGFYHAEADIYRLKFLRIGDDETSGDETDGRTVGSIVGSADSHPNSPILPSTAENPTPPSSTPACSDKPSSAHIDLVPGCHSLRRTHTTSSPRSASPTSRAPKKSSKYDADDTTTTKTHPACRYWCRTGTCKWGKRCRYQHVMPTHAEGLASAGLDAYPEWWLATIGALQVPSEQFNRPTKKPTTKRKYSKGIYKSGKKSRRLVEKDDARVLRAVPPSAHGSKDASEVTHTVGRETEKSFSVEDNLIEL